MLGGEDQDPMAESSFTKIETGAEDPLAIVDLTEAYEKHARAVRRGVRMASGRRAVLVQDEFRIRQPCELVWGVTTDAEVEVRNDSRALMTLNGEKLVARILSPNGAGFVVESSEQEPPQKKNAGVKRLMIRIPEAGGNVRVAVLFSPAWTDGQSVESVDIEPLAQW
jgi:hypothetical protein